MRNILDCIINCINSLVDCCATKGCKQITEQEILEAQKAWGDAIVRIGQASDYRAVASDCIDKLYAYDEGAVLFKPTKASEHQFRMNKEEALSYFVGGKFEEDQGFALAPFTSVRFENKGFISYSKFAIVMGNYYFTKKDGEELVVEYTFGYIRRREHELKINLHHSSLPFFDWVLF